MPFIVTAFSQNGVPQTGLSATIDIYRVSDGALIVNGWAMAEIAGGLYRFNFDAGAGFVVGVEYAFRADGGAALGASRYVFGGSELDADSVADGVLDEQLSGHLTAGTVGEAITHTLGLSGKNKVVEVLAKDLNGLPLAQRVRVYDTAANANTNDGATGLLVEHNVTSSFTSGSMDDFLSTQ